MALALNPARKKALAWTIVVAGSALIAQQLLFGNDLSGGDAPADAPVPPRSRANTEPRPDRPVLQIDRLEHAAAAASAAGDDDVVALFEARPWVAPPPPAPPPPPPPKPVAPPFPYTYIGGLLDGDVRTGFFTRNGGRVLAVHAGDTLDGVYRVDDMSDTQMNLTYLPINETMVVALRDAR